MKWQVVELGDVAVVDRRTAAPDEILPGTKYVGLEHIRSGGGFITVPVVSVGDIASAKFKFTHEHVLFGKLRPYLAKIEAPSFEGVCSTDILPVLPGASLDKRYLLHYLRQPAIVDLATTRSSGANLPRLNPKELEKFLIPLPPLAEQRRIAAILDCAGTLQALACRALTTLGLLSQSIFHDMFSTFDWSVEFGNVIASGPSNGLYRPASDYGEGVPILRIDGFASGAVISDSSKWKCLRADDKEIQRYSLAPGDLVVNRVNALSHLGKSALIAAVDGPSVYESNIMRIRIDPTRANNYFVLAWLQAERTKQQILRKAKKAINQASINQADVKSLLLPLPPLELQHRFAERVRAIEAKRASVERFVATTDELIATLQFRAFHGEL